MVKKNILSGLIFVGFLLVAYPALAGYIGALDELFFYHHPSARAEAMGKGYVAVDGDVLASFYNPAGLASARGILITGSYLPTPFYLLEKSSLSFIGGSFQVGDYGVVGLSRYHLSYGKMWEADELGRVIGKFNFYESMYALTLATNLEYLLLGVNLKLIHQRMGSKVNTNSGLADLGILKSFSLEESQGIQQEVKIGASLFNFTYSSIGSSNQEDELPVIFRLGGSYQISLFKGAMLGNLRTLDALCHIEYQRLFNSKYRRGIKVGGELTFLQVLALRYGYYRQNINDYGYPEVNKNLLSENTYGWGVQIPLRQFSHSKIPLDLKFDMVRLPQPNYIKTAKMEEEFSLYTLSVNWLL